MKHFLAFTFFLMTLGSFDISDPADDFKFGIKYNTIRIKLGVPLIQNNMVKQDGYGTLVLYNIKQEPANKAYHFSKAIVAFDEHRVYQEKDIYRKNLDDTTIEQLDIDVFYDWDKDTVFITGSAGKLDKRKFAIKAEDYLKPISPPKLRAYKWEELDLTQIDNLLNSWQLSRFDKE